MATTGDIALPPARSGPAGGARYSSPSLILTLLLLAVVISFVDRQVIGVLVDPIRADLGLTDFQMGIVGGTAFFAPYLIGGIAGGWAVDRYSRTAVVGIGMTFWSVMTTFCGMSTGFAQLFAGRMGVGFGEGTLGPGVHSLIADTFDKKRLPMAMSIYSAAGALGSGAALVVGGLILQHLTRHGTARIPLLSGFAPWQLTFIAVGVPGFVIGPLIYFVLRIPPRVAVPRFREDGLLREIGDFWRTRRRLLILYTLGVGTVSGAKLSFVLWIPTLLTRVHRMQPGVSGPVLGTMFVVFGLLGSLLWGVIAGRAARRGRDDSSMMTMVWAVGGLAAMVTLPPLMPSGALVLIFMAPCLMLAQSFIGLGHAGIQLVTPSALRGRVSALFNGVATLLGVIVGPTGTGALTTYFFADDQKLGSAIALMTGLMCAVGFFCLLLAVRPYREALRLLAASMPPATD